MTVDRAFQRRLLLLGYWPRLIGAFAFIGLIWIGFFWAVS